MTERRPAWIWILASLMALLSCWPFWSASRATPEGWRFTGVVHPSPDFVQYRVWMRQSQSEGPIVTDRFTTEPNRAHLPVFFYFGLGRVARLTGARPESIMALAAAPLTFVLVLLLHLTVRVFIPPGPARGWALFAMLFGGGLGAYLKELRDVGLRLGSATIGRLVGTPMQEAAVFEDLRGTYLITSIFDTHFLLIWLLTTAGILAVYLAIVRPGWWRLLWAAVLCAAITLVHVYEGVLLLAILASVLLLLWRRGSPLRPALLTGAVCSLVTIGMLALLAVLQRRSGLPMPEWRGQPVLLALFVAGFPVQLLVIATGLRRYWEEARREDLFLLGWMTGCVGLTFAGPFYPWPARGLMTLSIPFAIVAAKIYFWNRPKMALPHAVIAILLLGLTPVQVIDHLGRRTRFRDTAPTSWISPERLQILGALDQTARPADILAARSSDVLWLAPEFPGRHYAGHFFLTVEYERKRAELEQLSQLPRDARKQFLQEHGITLLYVSAEDHPVSFRGITGLTPLMENSTGTLFRYVPGPLNDN